MQKEQSEARLTNRNHWESRWTEGATPGMAFNPLRPAFRERHQLFQRYIKPNRSGTCLEVGAYPGTYLKYFYEYFGYTPWGVEYVDAHARRAENILRAQGVPASFLVKDFFELDARESPGSEGWDLTVSFGFVEHFVDCVDVVAKHIELTSPGGIVAISIPNHFGINGKILSLVDKNKWMQHNLMSLADLTSAASRAGAVEILFGGYVGRIGFWNAGVYSKLHNKFRKLYPAFRAPFWLLEQVGQRCIPNNRITSPDALVILRKC